MTTGSATDLTVTEPAGQSDHLGVESLLGAHKDKWTENMQVIFCLMLPLYTK